MIRLNRTTEYGLIALRHMSRKGNEREERDVTSAREIADCYGLPFEITAKTLQRLRDTGLIHSAHGAHGGYTLRRSLSEVTLAEFLRLMEGPQSLVHCTPAPGEKHKDCACEYQERCEMKGFMADLNWRVHQFLDGIRLAELAESPLAVAAAEEP